jgi:cytochrome c-type biogenesis protein CcmH
MIEFWIAAALTLLLGFAFFLPALTGRAGPSGADRAKLNLLLHRQRQQELAQETADPDDLGALDAESERNLLGDLEAAESRPVAAQEGGRAALIVTLLAVPLAALLAYFALGRPDLLGMAPAVAHSGAGTAAPANAASLEDSIQRLAERLKQNPNDLEGWTMLGRSLLIVNQPDKAVVAFEQALRLAPEDLDVQARYAEALADANQGALEGRPTEIVEAILKRDPNHKGALWMAGVAAAERKDAAKAVAYWERLKAQFPPESEEAQQLGRYIAEAQGLPAPAEPAPPAVAQAPGKRIRVKVALAEAFKDRAAPDDALFIFARAAEGPPMPLAVVKKRAGELPVEVVLDDSMAMMPGLSLSAFDRVIVGARISKSGKPTPSPGDLQGQVGPVAPEDDASYSVTVDQVAGEGR